MLDRDDSVYNYYADRTDTTRSVIEMMEDTYSQAVTINQSYWTEADIDIRFKTGDQTLWNDYYGNLPAFRRKQFYFNRIRRLCNLVTGHQRRNRKSTIAIPVEHDDDVAAGQWTKLLYHAMHHADAPQFISEAFEHGTVTTGLSLLNVWMDYTKDPLSGDVMVDHVPYNSFLIDPYFKKQDLSDCNFIWRRQWLSKDAIMSMLPKDRKEIEAIQPRGNRDGKFQFMAEAYNYGMRDLLSYDEYWYRDMREAVFVYDLENGLTKEWTGSKEDLKRFLAAYPGLVARNHIVPTVKLAICVDGNVFYHGKNPMGIDRYPFVAFLGYYEPNIPYFPWRCQGMVRNLRDSQFLYNRRKIIELDILESQVNSGWLYKPGSLVNPNDVFMEGQGKGIAIQDDKELTDVQRIEAPSIPPGMLQLSEILGREIMEISGVNEELLGSADDDKAGILSMLRQGAGLTTLQTLFDQADFSQKQLGELFMMLIQKHYSFGKVARIINEQPMPEFKHKAFLNYDIRVEEGVNTATQRQAQFVQLLHLREMGLPIPTKTLIEASTVENKHELVEDIMAQEQQASQMAMLQQQAQIELLQAQIQDLQGKAIANEGLGVERISRVQENRALAVERTSQAKENRQQAALNMAKTLKELQEIDLNQIERMLTLASALQQQASQGSDEVQQAESDIERETLQPLGLGSSATQGGEIPAL